MYLVGEILKVPSINHSFASSRTIKFSRENSFFLGDWIVLGKGLLAYCLGKGP